MTFSEQFYRTYRIYECNRCGFARIQPAPLPKDRAEKRRMGFCKASGKEIPIYDDPQYDLWKAPDECGDFNLGKPRKKTGGKEDGIQKIA